MLTFSCLHKLLNNFFVTKTNGIGNTESPAYPSHLEYTKNVNQILISTKQDECFNILLLVNHDTEPKKTQVKMTIHLDMALEKLHLWTFVMQQKIQKAQLEISCIMIPVVTALLGLKVKKCPTWSIAPMTYNMALIIVALKFLLSHNFEQLLKGGSI